LGKIGFLIRIHILQESALREEIIAGEIISELKIANRETSLYIAEFKIAN